MRDTIFALSSGRPPAAIAVVRVSGPGAGAALRALAGRVPQSRVATLSPLRDEAGNLLDTALLLWFPGPASVTGEDVAELHLHGSVAVIAAVSAALSAAGARPAEPGEFTRRALANGKLDLAGVEGLANLLMAETETQRRDALLRGKGEVHRLMLGWAQRLTDLAAQLEAAIDFDGEDQVALFNLWPAVSTMIDEMQTRLDRLPAEQLREGVRVAIIGPPNAGKSTLFNALLETDAAIVSPIAGTTRDILERPVAIGGVPFVLADTAGDRDALDPIEQEGVRRAREVARAADIVIDLGPAATMGLRTIAVSAQSDRMPPRAGSLAVSARTGEGMAALLDMLPRHAGALLPADGQSALNARQRAALSEALEHLRPIASLADPLLQAHHLAEARATLSRLVDGSGLEDMLDALFARFCLGK